MYLSNSYSVKSNIELRCTGILPCFVDFLGVFYIFTKENKASQAIQSPRTVPFFLLVSLLDGYSFPNVLVKGIVALKH